MKGMLCDCEQIHGVNIRSEVYERQRTSKKEARASSLFLILRLSLPTRQNIYFKLAGQSSLRSTFHEYSCLFLFLTKLDFGARRHERSTRKLIQNLKQTLPRS